MLAYSWRERAARRALSAPGARLAVFLNNHHPFALIGAEEDDTAFLKCSPDLVARRLVHAKPVCGLDALQSGQRYQGLVSERLLIPTKQRAGGP